jgi:hypothetical protein
MPTELPVLGWPTTAAIRVCRPKKFWGSAFGFSVVCDGNTLGSVESGEIFECKIPVGTHVLRVEYLIHIPGIHPASGGGFYEGRSPNLNFHFVSGHSYSFEVGYLGGVRGFLSSWSFAPTKLYFRYSGMALM